MLEIPFSLMRLFHDRGVCIQDESELRIDTAGKSEHAFITHAHSDHSNTQARNVHMTSATHKLAKGRIRKYTDVKEIKYGQKIKHGEYEVSFHDAGHILGSAQVHITNSSDIVVTSDFKLQDSIIGKGAEIISSDVLVIESTFGLPYFQFPDREIVYDVMGKWIKENAKAGYLTILGGYATGKAQELTKICNEYAGITPLVHEKIFENNDIYQDEGCKLGDYIKINHNLNESDVIIMPPSLISTNLKQVLEDALHKKIKSAMATGWHFFGSYDKLFPLSDHADYQQLMAYVKEAQPKQVVTMHGYAKELAQQIQHHLKIPARALQGKEQQTLLEFSPAI